MPVPLIAVDLLTAQGSKPLDNWIVESAGSYMLGPATHAARTATGRAETRGSGITGTTVSKTTAPLPSGRSNAAAALSRSSRATAEASVEKEYERSIKSCCHVLQGSAKLSFPSEAYRKALAAHHQQVSGVDQLSLDSPINLPHVTAFTPSVHSLSVGNATPRGG